MGVHRALRAVCTIQNPTTCSGGCLGSSSGEERSELRYAQRCAEFRELQSVERIAPGGFPARYVWIGVLFFSSPADFGL